MTISPHDIDRLVDGELPRDDQQRLLQSLDSSSDGWRQLSLAFLEAQAFQQACRRMVDDRPITAAMTRPAASSRRTLPIARWAASVAAVLLAFGLGSWTGQRPPLQTTQEAQPQMDLNNERAPIAAGEGDEGERVQIVFASGNGEFSSPVEVPVVEASQEIPRGDYAEQPGIPTALQDVFRKAGRDIQEREKWVPIVLRDGRCGLIPVREWVVSPIQAAVTP